MKPRTLFADDAEAAAAEPGESERCTPERLLAFIEESRRLHGRSPTLRECKERFGGVLGALVDAWALRKQGLI